MKIAHVNFIPYDNVLGVEKKIREQAIAAKDLNLPIDYLILNSKVSKVDNNLKLIKLKTSKISLIRKLQLKFFRFSVISNTLNLNEYDYIILRYINMDFSAKKFSYHYGNKIITEHHSDELGEIKSHKQTLITQLRYLLEKKISPVFLSKVKGIICVTSEIRKVELEKIGKSIPNTVISNGIGVSGIEFTKFKKFDNTELNILFIASYFAPWHGLEIILKALLSYSGSVKINLNLIGTVSNNDIKNIQKIKNSNVAINILGRKNGSELVNYFKECNLAISSLALHKNNMTEACPLKTREYIARGVPFIYGYKDSDLDESESFSLRINTETNSIDIQELIKFAEKLNDVDSISYKERKFAIEKIDWKIKIKQTYDFIESV